MNRLSMRSNKLSVQLLEDRSCRASFSYAPATQTLTLTCGHNEQLLVETLPNASVNYFQVTEIGGNTLVFDSNTAKQPVVNLTVNHTPTGGGYLTIANTVHLGGNLSVSGGPQEIVYVDGVVNGNFTYKEGAPGNSDTVLFRDQAKIGGNVVLNYGSGDSDTRIETGFFGGKFVINGGKDSDSLYVSKTGDIFIAGSAVFNFGDGGNNISAEGGHLIFVGGSLSYAGGPGNDYVDFNASGNPFLEVVCNANFNLGKTGNSNNDLNFGSISVGGSLSAAGAAGEDPVYIYGGMTVGKNLSLAFGSGKNTFYSEWNGAYSGSVGGSMTITAGAQADLIVLDNLTVGKSATINLGDSDTDDQSLWVGTEELGGISILGSLKITGGSKKDDIELHRLYVGKSLTVQAGDGADVVQVNDSTVMGASLFDLGGGNDLLLMETVTSDQAGNLSAPAAFGGLLTVKGGDGADTITLSADFNPATYINFGSKLVLQGVPATIL